MSAFSERKKVHSLVDLQKNQKVKLNRYDPISDTIAKNKMEAVRAEKFMRSLGHKINEGPQKNSNVIRTPLVGFTEPPDQLMNKMQLIDNQRYEQQLQKIRQKRRAQDEYVKFIGRNNSMSASKLSLKRNRSIIADSAQSQSIQDFKQNQMSNTMQLQAIKLKFDLQTAREEPVSQSFTYQQRLKMLMEEARSEIIGLNPQDKMMEVKYIAAMNKSIRKINNLQDELKSQRRKQNIHSSNKKNKPLGQLSKQEKYGVRKNLIDLTAKIRQQGSDIEVLSYYKDLIRARQLKEFLKQKESKEQVFNSS